MRSGSDQTIAGLGQRSDLRDGSVNMRHDVGKDAKGQRITGALDDDGIQTAGRIDQDLVGHEKARARHNSYRAETPRINDQR